MWSSAHVRYTMYLRMYLWASHTPGVLLIIGCICPSGLLHVLSSTLQGRTLLQMLLL